MTARGWRWVVALTVVATAAVGIAGGLDFVSNVYHRFYPSHTARVQCQDSAACRSFIAKTVHDQLAALLKEKGGGQQSGPNKGGQLTGGERAPRHRRSPLHRFSTWRRSACPCLRSALRT